MNEFERLLKIKEPLHPDLEPYFITDGGIPGIFHPLVYAIFHTEQQNAIVNRSYLYKKERAELALKTKDWSSFVFLHERPYRIGAFSEIHESLDDKTYWELLADIYTDSENIWQNKKLWAKFLKSKRRRRECFMNAEERKVFAAMPDIITIYRGYIKGKNSVGFSYSLSQETAEWFAKRFGRNGFVKKIEIKKKDALGYKSCRNEKEIILRIAL